MFKVTPKSARRADSFFISLPDGRRTRLFGATTYTLDPRIFAANQAVIRAAGCTVVAPPSSVEAPAAVEPVVVASPVVEPVEVVADAVVAEPEVSAPAEEPTPEDVVVDSTSDEPVSSDASPEEEKVTRRRRSKSVE